MRAVNVQSVERAAKLLAADSDYMHLAISRGRQDSRSSAASSSRSGPGSGTYRAPSGAL